MSYKIMIKRHFHTTLYNLLVAGSKGKCWKDNKTSLLALERFGLAREDLLAARGLLSNDIYYLKHASEILEESGMPVTIDNLIKFRSIFESKICDLIKNNHFISKDVTTRFLSYLEPFPYESKLLMPSLSGIAEFYKPIPQYYRRRLHGKEIVAGWPNNVAEEKNITLENEQRRVLRQYYVWRLMTDFSTIDKHMYNYSKITGLRSLRSIKGTLEILENQLELSKDKILRNFFLLSITPERLTEVIENVDKIGSISLKQAAQMAPKILAKSSQQIIEIEQLLKEHGVRDQSSFRVHVFTYSSATLRARLRQLADSDMSPFLEHPRVCHLIYYFTKAWRRMGEIRQRGIKCVSLNVLTSNEQVFQRFLADGVDRTYVANDIEHYLAYTLGVPKEEVSALLINHPYRFFVPVMDIKRTTEALLEHKFTKEQIFESLHVVLYPREKVIETLEYIATSQDLEKTGFSGGFAPSVLSIFPSGTKFRDKRLPLCLYFLEKPFHFSGEGVIKILNQNM